MKPSSTRALLFDRDLVPDEVEDGITYFVTHRYGRAPWNYLIRRGYLENLGLLFLEGQLLEDVIFTLPLISSATRVSHYPSTAYAYVRNPTGYTRFRSLPHQVTMIGAFRFVIEFLVHFAEEQSHNTAVTPDYLGRVRSLQDDYSLFLGIRLLRSPLSLIEQLSIYDDLSDRRRVPLVNLVRSEHPGAKYRTLVFLINHRLAFRVAGHSARLYQGVRRLIRR